MPGDHANLISIFDNEQVVEDEVEVVQRLTAWVDQLASIRSADPFVGLPVDEQSPVGPVRFENGVANWIDRLAGGERWRGRTLTTGCSGRPGRAGRWSPGREALILRAGAYFLSSAGTV